ncbi:MAG: hypothetical protein ABIP32_12565 [Chthoniobacterales bacterium]
MANSWLEWNASQNIIGQREPWFIRVPCARHLREIQRRTKSQLPEYLQSANECGDLCLTLEIARAAKLTEAEGLLNNLETKFLASLQEDRSADWARWPMRFSPFLQKPSSN